MSAIYTAIATSTGGRDGKAASSDGRLDVSLSVPEELGGDNGPGTNPEQLFAAGYSACYIGALKFVANEENIELPSTDIKVTASVGIKKNEPGVGFTIEVNLNVAIDGIDKAQATLLAEKAHNICPYSNATRGNITVNTEVA